MEVEMEKQNELAKRIMKFDIRDRDNFIREERRKGGEKNGFDAV